MSIENCYHLGLEYLHKSNCCKTLNLRISNDNVYVKCACLKPCDKTIECLYDTVPKFKMHLNTYVKLCKKCRNPVKYTSDENIKKRIRYLNIHNKYDTDIVDNTVESYNINSYKHNLNNLADGNYAEVIQDLSIVKYEKIVCCICKTTYTNIIKMSCNHYACLESLFEFYNDNQCDIEYCPKCLYQFQWIHCVSITDHFNCVQVKSARKI